MKGPAPRLSRQDRKFNTEENSMKYLKRITAFLLCMIMMSVLCAGTAFAAKDDDDDLEDYAVYDVFFDVSDSKILVCWTVGDSKCQYKVQLYDSSKFISKNKVGDASTVSYNAEMLDVTQKILAEGSGTYYAVVTAKKKPSGASSYASAWAKETIDSDSIALIKKTRAAQASETKATSTVSENAVTGVAGGPGVSAAGTAAAGSTASAGSSSGMTLGAGDGWFTYDNGTWGYRFNNGTAAATGWWEIGGLWYFFDENGVMAASRWIRSASDPSAWYYVGPNGDMLVNTVTPDGYTVDANGVWRQ